MISKFLSGNASPDEAMQVEDWKSENTDNLKHYLACEKIFLAMDKAGAKPVINEEKAWRAILDQIEPEAKTVPINKRSNLYLQIAASITLIFILGALVNYYMNTPKSLELTYQTTQKGLSLRLSDGSGIEIAGHSLVLVDKSFGKSNRTIRLKGKAKFNVTHQENLPFIVEAGEVFIKDVGTIFSVSHTENDSVFIMVEEGIVLVYDNYGTKEELKAGEQAVYLNSKKQLLSQSKRLNILKRLNFVGTTLAEVIKLLRETYATTIELEDPVLGQYTITATFNNEELDPILSIITETLGLSFEKTKNGYMIKGHK